MSRTVFIVSIFSTLFAFAAEGPARSISHLNAQELDWVSRSEFLQPRSGSLMEDLEAAILEALARGEAPALIVDLDDTVFDNRYGAARALRDWNLGDPDVSPEVAGKIRSYFQLHSPALPGSNPSEIFDAVGLKTGTQEFQAFETYFWKWVNSPEYAAKLFPIFPGVKERLHKLQKLGAKIIYLSGRREDAQGKQTRNVVRRAGLPLVEDSDVILKPRDMPTPEAKRLTLVELNKRYSVEAMFDNNPGNLMQMQKSAQSRTRFVLLASKFEDVPEKPGSGMYRASSWQEMGMPEHYSTTYLTDIEGDWRRLKSFTDGNPLLTMNASGRLELKPGAKFVYGGDAIDKGPDSLRVLDALLDLKRRHPDRVVLLAGNRDLNKMRLTSELAGFRGEERVAKLKTILSETMGAREAFAFRRDELARSRGRVPSDLEVAENFLAEVGPGGRMREYLTQAQLAYRDGNTLYVHGALNDEGMRGIKSIDEAILGRNRWYRKQISEWSRGIVPGELIRYQGQIPGTKANQASWVYGRYSDATGSPQMLSRANIEKLQAAGLRRIVVGHTPQSEVLTVMRENGFEVIIADNSPYPHAPQLFLSQEAVRIRAESPSLSGKMDFRLALNGETSPIGRRIAATGQRIVGQLTDGRLVGFSVGRGFKPELGAMTVEECLKSVLRLGLASH